MTTLALAVLAVVVAYSLGAIPFGYLVAYRVKGIDIRTVGSGNVGATNVGRVLGFRFFVLVFAFDVLKGLLPTLGLPRAVTALAGREVPALAVLVALAAILGHNFPVYLKFRGGKGVATSLGALSALDPVASGAAAVGFVTFLIVTRFVSLASVLGGVVFVVVHFVVVHLLHGQKPWDRDQLAMSLLTIGLLGMLIVRHRKNYARIAAGTEPKVSFRRRRPPSGRVALAVVLVLVAAAGATGVAIRARSLAELEGGYIHLVTLGRYATGHQRAERVAFADAGRLLAVTCPRYNRVVLYRVTDGEPRVSGDETLEVLRDIALDGRPVALWPTRDRLFVLQRPSGDARHVEAGYWETFDFQGRKLGSKVRIGFDPDDLAITPDGRWALVLTSGHAEGESNRPAPALSVVDLDSETPRVVGAVTFDRPGADPERITLSAAGRHAAVTLRGPEQVVGIDLADTTRPAITGRVPLAGGGLPHPSASEEDWIVMPGDTGRETIWLGPPENWRLLPSEEDRQAAIREGQAAAARSIARVDGYLASTLPEGSGVELLLATDHRVGSLGVLPLRGPANLGTVRPTGLAYSPQRWLLAVADRSGGVHLVAVQIR
ncbi:MAG TPA: glycerol-3-phosphate 1-O-acyltransferase PlsY [Isosphaeraceae bacterium]|jgi:glycerol-3-phosphate acyltransferase PlsY